jgi:NTE family protein
MIRSKIPMLMLSVLAMEPNKPELPTTSPEIHKRLNQITFNNSLRRDLEALSLMAQLCREGDMQNSRLGQKLRRLSIHRLAADDHVDGLSMFSFLNTNWAHLQHLRDQGRAAADAWLTSRSEFRTPHPSSADRPD